jgi:hypothetical protein
VPECIAAERTPSSWSGRTPTSRYAEVERIARSTRRQGVRTLAFGLSPREIRLVVEGNRHEVSDALRGLKVGTLRESERWEGDFHWGSTHRWFAGEADLEAAVAWAHRAPVQETGEDPLSSPWSSHRDLLRFRRARFYDASALDGRVDPRRVHVLAGGRHLPDGWPPPRDFREPLPLLLRVAGAVLGLLPADRRCFRLFAHLALARGWFGRDVAEALSLTERRVRQLVAEAEPCLSLGLLYLVDARLGSVP